MSRVWNDRDTLLDGIKMIKRKMKEIPKSNNIELEFKSMVTGLCLDLNKIKSFNGYSYNAINEMKQDYKHSINLIEQWRDAVEEYLLEKIEEKEKIGREK